MLWEHVLDPRIPEYMPNPQFFLYQIFQVWLYWGKKGK